jgi:hypothetical protein
MASRVFLPLFLVLACLLHAGPFTNGNFELPIVPAGRFNYLNPNDTWVPGWVAGDGPRENVDYRMSLDQGGPGFVITSIEGHQFFCFDGDSANFGCSISQTFSTEIGRTYTVDFIAAYTSFAYPPQTITVKARSDLGFPITSRDFRLDGRWLRFQFEFPAISSETVLVFQNTSQSTYTSFVGLDDVTVTESQQTLIPALIAKTNKWEIQATTTLTITNHAFTPTPPINFYPSPQFPVAASISPDGVFTWKTSLADAGTSQQITIWAVDGNNRSNSITHTVTVPNYFSVILDPTPSKTSDPITIPLSIYSSVPMLSFWFDIKCGSELLTNWSIITTNPLIKAATATTFTDGTGEIRVDFIPNQAVQGLVNIGTLSAQTISDKPFVSLAQIGYLYYQRANGIWTADAVASATNLPRIVAVGAQALLDLQLNEPPNATLMLYGEPGVYQLFSATDLTPPLAWTPVSSFELTNFSYAMPINLNLQQALFFKAVRQ